MAVKDEKTPKNPNTSPDGSKSRNTKPSRVESDIWKDEKPSPFSIEGIRSGAVQSSFFKGLIIVSGIIMAGGFMMTSINPLGRYGAGNGGGGGAPINPADTVARVGDQTVERGAVDNALAQQEQMAKYGFSPPLTPESYLDEKTRALNNLAGQAALVAAAKKMGMTVSGDEIDKKVDEYIAESMKPQPGQEAAMRRQIEAKYGSMAEAPAKMREEISRDKVEQQLLADKLEKSVKDGNKVTADDYKRSLTKLKLWQIVLRPELPKGDSKTFEADQKKNAEKTSKEAATLFVALKAKPTLVNFKTTAQKDSDDVATKSKGGDFGWKLPSELFPADWSDAVSKSASSLVGPLKDDAGDQTIFFIESRKTDLPKDFAKNQKKLGADYEKTQDDAVWSKQQETLKKTFPPAIEDQALAAYQAVNDPTFATQPVEQQKQVRERALTDFQGALNGANGLEAAAINLQIAAINDALGHKPQQLAALQAAVKEAPDDANLRLMTARALRDGKQTKQALAELAEASKALDNAPPAPPPSPFGGGGGADPNATRAQISAEYTMLGKKDLADAEIKKIKLPAPNPMRGMGGMGGLPPGVQVVPGR